MQTAARTMMPGVLPNAKVHLQRNPQNASAARYRSSFDKCNVSLARKARRTVRVWLHLIITVLECIHLGSGQETRAEPVGERVWRGDRAGNLAAENALSEITNQRRFGDMPESHGGGSAARRDGQRELAKTSIEVAGHVRLAGSGFHHPADRRGMFRELGSIAFLVAPKVERENALHLELGGFTAIHPVVRLRAT
jgi:hypothetical protein